MQQHDITTAAQLGHWPQMISLNTFLVWCLSFKAANILYLSIDFDFSQQPRDAHLNSYITRIKLII